MCTYLYTQNLPLAVALEQPEAHEALAAVLGEDVLRVHLAVRRSENALFGGKPLADELSVLLNIT